MPQEQVPGKPQTRRYSPEEKASAVRMVRTLRAELGTDHGTVKRVAMQLGCDHWRGHEGFAAGDFDTGDV